MGLKAKKVAVFAQLALETEPIGLVQLLAKLGEGYAERTVRRWLREDAGVQKVGQKRGMKYFLGFELSEVEWWVREKVEWFKEGSLKVVEAVRKPVFMRRPVAYNEEWVDAYVPNETFYVDEGVRRQLWDMGRRSKGREPAGTYAHQIFNRLLIDLSYNSSRLEGNSYSLLETKELLFSGRGAEGKLDEETVMILNHKEAIRYLVDRAHRIVVNEEVVRTVHFLLADGLVGQKYAGHVRDQGVRIGGSVYLPYERKRELEMVLGRVLGKAAGIRDPYEQSFFLLVHVSYLQPFLDVNKRTARVMANVPLVRNNLVPLSFNDVEKDNYIDAMLAVYELQEVGPLRDLFAFSYLRTCGLYDETVKTLGFDEVRVRLRRERRSVVRGVILGQMQAREVGKMVREEDRAAFVEDVREDLEGMDEGRLVGLGVTVEQLREWKTKKIF